MADKLASKVLINPELLEGISSLRHAELESTAASAAVPSRFPHESQDVMTTFLLFVLLGLGSGALYAGLSMSIVLSYRGSGLINLAAGSFAVVSGFVFFGLRTAGYLWLPPLPFAPHRIQLGGPWAFLPAFLVAIFVALLIGVLFELLVVRPLRNAAPLAKLVATLGVFLTITAVIVLRFGSTGELLNPILPSGIVSVAGADVPQDRLWLTGIVVIAAILLIVLYRYSSFGLSTRAAAENEVIARLDGLSPNRLSMLNTLLAALLCGVLGVLAAPLSQLDSTTIPLAVIPALGAALLASFTSFGIATVAGLAMGIIESLLIWLQSKSWFPTAGGQELPGVSDLVFFIIIVGATYWRGSSIPDRGTILEKRLPAAPAARRLAQPVIACIFVVILGALVFPYDFRQAFINSLIGIIFCLSLTVITGFVGQISLMQVALAGIAGFILQKVAAHAGIGFPLGPLIGIAGATAFGFVAAISALRVRGVNLAIVTLAAAVAIENFGFDNPTWGGGAAGSPVSPPHLLGIDLGPAASFPVGVAGNPSPVFVLVCGALAVGLGYLVASLRRSGLGQRMLAVRANERAAAAAGVSVRNVKLGAFVISSAMAGVAGCLYAYNFGGVSADRFDIVIALTFVAYAYIGGITTVRGAVLGGLGVTEGLLGHAIDKWLGVPDEYQLLVGGLLLVFTIVLNPGGIALTKPPGFAQLQRWRAQRGPAATGSSDSGPASADLAERQS